MSKTKDFDIDELYNSYFVKVRVTGNKSKRTPIDNFSMSVSASVLDEKSRKDLAKITKKLQRLPEKYRSMKIGKRVIIHTKDIQDFETEYDLVKKEFEDFISNLDLDNLRDLHKEREDIEINKDTEFISSVEQISIPLTQTELHDWFHCEIIKKKVKSDDSFLNGIIEKTKDYLDNLEKDINNKTKELETRENLVKEEKERLETQLQRITERRDKLKLEVEQKFQEGLKTKEEEHIALIDSQIALQLQEFYLTLEKSLDDFKTKGKVNGMKLKSIENKIAELKKSNNVFQSASVDAIVESLEGFPQAFRDAQIKLHSQSGELPDFDLFEIDFKGYDNVKHQNSLPLVENTLEDFESFSLDFNSAILNKQKAKEESTPKDKIKVVIGFPCDICQTTYKTERSLKSHEKSKKHKANLKANEPTFEFEPIQTN